MRAWQNPSNSWKKTLPPMMLQIVKHDAKVGTTSCAWVVKGRRIGQRLREALLLGGTVTGRHCYWEALLLGGTVTGRHCYWEAL